jgi:N-acetylmuramoyl-L-alanine amidase
LADDALWQRSELFLRHGSRRAPAARAVREILATYPKGDMAARARKRAAELSDVAVEPADREAEATAKGKLVGRRAEGGGVPQVTSIKHWSNPDYTRVSIYLSGPASARAGDVPAAGGKPARVYVDIKKARLSQKVGTATPVHDDLLQGVRAGQFRADTVRVVLDLQTAVHHRVMVMENPYRVVVDAFSGAAPARPKTHTDVELRGRRVVVDPGHGGRDGGANGPGKVREKHVTLAIAREVGRLLEAQGVDVVMTRTDDSAVALEERTAIANRVNADLFVSIHANSHKNRKVRGVETYYLNVTDDAYSIRLAAMENRTSEEQVSDLQLILADLATKVNTEESAALAKRVQAKLMKAIQPHNPKTRDLGVKSSLFYVLLGARMPSILVETGFLSHKGEGKLLTRVDYQKATARAIATGLLEHLRAPREAQD